MSVNPLALAQTLMKTTIRAAQSTTRGMVMAEPSVDQVTVPAARSTVLSDATQFARRWLLRVPPAVVVIAAVALVAAGQVAEDLADSEPLQLLSPLDAVRRWTLILAVLYMLGISRAVDRFVKRSLADLDAAFHIDPERFRHYALRVRRPDVLVDAMLLAISGVLVVLLFGTMQTSLPIDDPVTGQPVHLPTGVIGLFLIFAQYTVVGWAVLSLVYCTISRARALGQLSRVPLEIDVFDTTNLLPLGNIALATALAPAGIIVILLIGFGRPSSPISWSLLVLVTLASLVALILPLRGIHRQMDAAKGHVLTFLNGELRKVYEQVNLPGATDITETTRLNHRASTLVNLRKTVDEMTTWPFRDTLALTRAVLIAMAPLIYTVINELIKLFWIAPLAR
jgi:hypothetical protein